MKQFTKTVSAVLLLAPLCLPANAAENQAPKPEQPMPGMNMQAGKGDMGGMGGMMNMQSGQGGMMNMQQGKGGMQGMGMGMMGGMSEEQMDQHLRMKQEHLLQMHELSNKILTATDPKEKELLKEQQLKLMKAHHAAMMAMMHGGMKMNMEPKNPKEQQQDVKEQQQDAPGPQDIQHLKHHKK